MPQTTVADRARRAAEKAAAQESRKAQVAANKTQRDQDASDRAGRALARKYKKTIVAKIREVSLTGKRIYVFRVLDEVKELGPGYASGYHSKAIGFA
jgi:hypothetical protein